MLKKPDGAVSLLESVLFGRVVRMISGTAKFTGRLNTVGDILSGEANKVTWRLT